MDEEAPTCGVMVRDSIPIAAGEPGYPKCSSPPMLERLDPYPLPYPPTPLVFELARLLPFIPSDSGWLESEPVVLPLSIYELVSRLLEEG